MDDAKYHMRHINKPSTKSTLKHGMLDCWWKMVYYATETNIVSVNQGSQTSKENVQNWSVAITVWSLAVKIPPNMYMDII